MALPKSAAENELGALFEQEDEWTDDDLERSRELRASVKKERAEAARKAQHRPRRESVAGESDRDGRGHEQTATGLTASEIMAAKALRGGR